MLYVLSKTDKCGRILVLSSQLLVWLETGIFYYLFSFILLTDYK